MTTSSILAIDCAMSGCSVGVSRARDGRVFSRVKEMTNGHAEALVPIVEQVMEKAGLSYDALDAVVTSVGPGAFTGLRVGMSAAKGFGLALGIPVAGVTTLECLARGYAARRAIPEGHTLCALVETRREDYYVQLFDRGGNPAGTEQAFGAEKILELLSGQRVVFVGDAVRRFSSDVDTAGNSGFEYVHDYYLIEPHIMVGLCAEKLSCGYNQEYRDLNPLYLRGANISYPKYKGRVLEER